MASAPSGVAEVFRRLNLDIIHFMETCPLHSATVRLERRANTFNTFYMGSSGDWILIRSLDMDLPETVHVGLFVTSHQHDKLAEATFLDYSYENYFYPSASPSLSSMPTIYVPSRDIGDTNLAGSSTITPDGTITMKGSGNDIWGTRDAFHFMHRPHKNGDFSVEVFVESIIFNNSWAKAGVMIRNSLSNASPHVFMMLSGSNGSMLQWRGGQGHGSGTSNNRGSGGWRSIWVKLEKIGNTFNGYRRLTPDDEWDLTQTVQVNMPEDYLQVGLALTSHNNGFLSTAVFKNYVGPKNPNQGGNDIGFRFSKIAFPDQLGNVELPADLFPDENSDILDVLKDSYCPSVTRLDDDEVYLDVRALIKSDFVGGYPSHPSDSKTDEFWAYLDEVINMQAVRRVNNGNDLAIDYMPLPDIWEGYTLAMVAEAVHDEYPNLHQSANLARMLAAGGVKIDNNVMPQRSHKQFLRGPVAISDLNTWATAVVGPHSFASKYHVGRARPEEVAFAIKERVIEESFVPGYILDKIDSIPNFDFAVNFTAYGEGSPRHPSWPAMHSAASQTSFWMSVVLDLTPEQLCQARLVDWGVAYARTVAGVHYGDDNIQGLNIGQEVIAQLLPIYMKNKYGSDQNEVEAKVAKMRYNWFDFDPEEPCPESPRPIFSLDAEDYSGSGPWIDQISGIACTIGANTVFSSDDDGSASFHFDYSQESMILCPFDISPSKNYELTLEILFKLDDDFNPNLTNGWILGSDNGGYDRGLILSDNRFGGVGQGIGSSYISGLSTPSNGEWHHAIATYAQNVNQASFVCIDNKCGYGVTANNSDGETSFSIGGLRRYSGHVIKGAVAGVRIYKRAFDREMAENRQWVGGY